MRHAIHFRVERVSLSRRVLDFILSGMGKLESPSSNFVGAQRMGVPKEWAG